jgi:WD40 repeat protein
METKITEEEKGSANTKPNQSGSNEYNTIDNNNGTLSCDNNLNTETEKGKMKLLAKSDDVRGDDNFVQGCSFSPDGLCVLTSTANDGQIRLYNTPLQHQMPEDGWKSVLNISGGECVRSYAWYPLMNSYEPTTCAFVAASRGRPIHLLDAYTGNIRASYCPHNALDEMESPNVVEFTPDGNRIFAAGFQSDRTIQVFDTAMPGREPSAKLRLGKTRRSSDGQKGLISAIAFPSSTDDSANPHLFAVGTYSPGSIYIYDDRASPSPVANVILNTGVCIVGHGKSFARKKRRFLQVENDNNEEEEEKKLVFECKSQLVSKSSSRWGYSVIMVFRLYYFVQCKSSIRCSFGLGCAFVNRS